MKLNLRIVAIWIIQHMISCIHALGLYQSNQLHVSVSDSRKSSGVLFISFQYENDNLQNVLQLSFAPNAYKTPTVTYNCHVCPILTLLTI